MRLVQADEVMAAGVGTRKGAASGMLRILMRIAAVSTAVLFPEGGPTCRLDRTETNSPSTPTGEPVAVAISISLECYLTR